MKAEEERLANDWMTECRKELMGRRVEPKEMDCLLHAKTLVAIGTCGEPSKGPHGRVSSGSACPSALRLRPRMTRRSGPEARRAPRSPSRVACKRRSLR